MNREACGRKGFFFFEFCEEGALVII